LMEEQHQDAAKDQLFHVVGFRSKFKAG
jgi:hypothetical protein